MTSRRLIRRRLLVDGIVQGVGFRPFVYNLARAENLTGYVTNTSDGVVIEIQGSAQALDRFTVRLGDEAPPLAEIVGLATEEMDPATGTAFEIRASVDGPGTRTLIPYDVATCVDCVTEIRDPGDRRLGYPFTNCTNCGPRWTIIGRIPYDRPHTSMAGFTMCPRCQTEYDDPGDRRFHAQPNACPDCGPQVWLENEVGTRITGRTDPLETAAGLLAVGRILAIKGLGGFHLAVRADDEQAVARLRRLKNREAKPLAVMVADLEVARQVGVIGAAEEKLLASPRAPIVLVEKITAGQLIAPAVAPGHRRLGVMLPYTPLHHLLLDKMRARGVSTLVMTSGNASDEPICLSNEEAKERLNGIADSFLLHDRDIVRRADDSVVQDLDGVPLLFRRSRGYAPVPIHLRTVGGHGPDILAVGPELKNTVCLLKEDRAFLSPHIGDLANLQAFEFFTETVATVQGILESEPRILAHDLHPGYFSTRWAKEQAGAMLEPVQHHHAHLAAVMAEHGLRGPVLGLIMDGTGYGTDGTIWGGEILAGDLKEFQRVGHLDPVPLPGGDAAIRAPWRTAVSYLRHAFGDDLPALPWMADLPVAAVVEMLDKGVNSPATSSCGRLFDAVAALTGGWLEAGYEAQAAIELMALTTAAEVRAAASLVTDPAPEAGEDTAFIIPVTPVVRGAVAALNEGARPAEISARFHRTLIDILVAAARRASRLTGLEDVVLAGGVFQNEILLGETARVLRGEGLAVHRPVLVPANDGAVALGQAVVARARHGGRS